MYPIEICVNGKAQKVDYSEVCQNFFHSFLNFGFGDMERAIEILAHVYEVDKIGEILAHIVKWQNIHEIEKTMKENKIMDICGLCLLHVVEVGQSALSCRYNLTIDLTDLLKPYCNYINSGFNCDYDTLARALGLDSDNNLTILAKIIRNEISLNNDEL